MDTLMEVQWEINLEKRFDYNVWLKYNFRANTEKQWDTENLILIMKNEFNI